MYMCNYCVEIEALWACFHFYNDDVDDDDDSMTFADALHQECANGPHKKTQVINKFSIYSIFWATALSSFTQVSTLKNTCGNRYDIPPPDVGVRGQCSLPIDLAHPMPTHHLLMNI